MDVIERFLSVTHGYGYGYGNGNGNGNGPGYGYGNGSGNGNGNGYGDGSSESNRISPFGICHYVAHTGIASQARFTQPKNVPKNG